MLHVVKSSLGGGVLTMPYAFKNAGLAFGVVAALFIGIIVTHATASLVRIKLITLFFYQWKNPHSN